MKMTKEFKENLMKTFVIDHSWLEELFPRYKGETTKRSYIYLSKEIY